MGSKSMEKLIQIVKIIAPHILIFIAVGLYIMVGGVVFVYLESPSTVTFANGSDSNGNGTMLFNTSNSQTVKTTDAQTCSDEHLEITLDALYYGCCGAQIQTTEECFFLLRDDLINCFNLLKKSYQTPTGPAFVPKQSTNEWDFSSALILSFTIVTTIGYGHIAPKTATGRLFCVFYGLLGIPLTLLAIADHGRFLASALQFMYVKVKKLFGKLRNKQDADDDQQQSSQMENESLSPLFLLILYCGYLFFGSLLLIEWEEEWTFSDAFYFGFISLSTIGFGDVVPNNRYYLPWTLAYIGIGLILSSTAIDILAEYLKKLHQFGKKIRNVTHAKIWFGGKALTVKELVSTVGKYLGATEETLSHLVQNLDTVVNHAIVQKETGAEPEALLIPYKDAPPTKVVVETPKVPSPSPSPPVIKPENMDRRKSYHQEADFIDDQELDDDENEEP